MSTITDIVHRYRKTADEVRAALAAIGFDKRSVNAKISADEERLLDAHWKERSEFGRPESRIAKDGESGRERKSEIKQKDAATGREKSVSVTVRRKREFKRPQPPISSLPRSPIPPPIPAATPTPAAIPSASASPNPSIPPPTLATPPPPIPSPREAVSPQKVIPSSEEKPRLIRPDDSPPTPIPSAKPEFKPIVATEKTTAEKPATPLVAPIPSPTVSGAKTPTPTVKAESPAVKTATAGMEGRRQKRGTIRLGKEAAARRGRRAKAIRRRLENAEDLSSRHAFQKPTTPVIREIEIPETISVQSLAQRMAMKGGEIIRRLMEMEMMVTINQMLDRDTAWLIAEEFGHKPVAAREDDLESDLAVEPPPDADYRSRAPVVTVMGHVDHGKTSLLDYVRKTRVAAGEAGGITQHIGACRVTTAKGPVTFLDTPGHELFAEMRARGAKATDIIVLVVAADDGVKRQTIEAINHAKAAKVPLLVAASKIDKPDVNLDKVKRELSENGVVVEDWGGDAIFAPVSAKTGEGVEHLLEAIALQSEILELKAAVNLPARGLIIEARMEKGRGPMATGLVQQGILEKGQVLLCGSSCGRVRALRDDAGKMTKRAEPSQAVEIQGLSALPEVGSEFLAMENEKRAREVALFRQGKLRASRLIEKIRPVPQTMTIEGEAEEKRELNLIVKADVSGSREALAAALSHLSAGDVEARVLDSGVGAVSESDINLADASAAMIIAFNVRADAQAKRLMESRGVIVRHHGVIFEAVEDVQAAMTNMLAPVMEETVIGQTEVRQIFRISKVGNIAGCLVTEGVARAAAQARVVRDGAAIYTGDISSLRHFKAEVAEVASGSECGIGIRRFNDIKVGDALEILEVSEKPPAP